jgi:hypothetical protein
LPEVPPVRTVPADPIQALRDCHEAQGLRLHAGTTRPGWMGERLDVGYAIDVLHPLATREATLRRAPVDRSTLSPVGDRPDCVTTANPSADALPTTKLAAVDARAWRLD